MHEIKKVSVSSNELNPDIREILEKYGQTVDGLIADLSSPRELYSVYSSSSFAMFEQYECALYYLYRILHPEFRYKDVKRFSGNIVPVRVLDVPKEV